ncbi:hypothetical protein COCNU_07G008230 [Cocos nucifera]|uniref:Uncharacterized protein n=1 Tax=Cocos nucifera TaxID=13894 RepID=A0A8K0N512_COCNU|nr:hypothetical protein COCNU_07G008230 [Cocos nucifera]
MRVMTEFCDYLTTHTRRASRPIALLMPSSPPSARISNSTWRMWRSSRSISRTLPPTPTTHHDHPTITAIEFLTTPGTTVRYSLLRNTLKLSSRYARASCFFDSDIGTSWLFDEMPQRDRSVTALVMDGQPEEALRLWRDRSIVNSSLGPSKVSKNGRKNRRDL